MSGPQAAVNETILVVDDDPDIAHFVEVNLASAGYDVAVAFDGEEGLEKATALLPDLVLLDVMMPRIDGFEVAQRLRRDPRTSGLAIIMLTAKALATDKVIGLTSGADDYVVKPFDPVGLLARVRGTLRRFAAGETERPFFDRSGVAPDAVLRYLAARTLADYLATGSGVEVRLSGPQRDVEVWLRGSPSGPCSDDAESRADEAFVRHYPTSAIEFGERVHQALSEVDVARRGTRELVDLLKHRYYLLPACDESEMGLDERGHVEMRFHVTVNGQLSGRVSGRGSTPRAAVQEAFASFRDRYPDEEAWETFVDSLARSWETSFKYIRCVRAREAKRRRTPPRI